MAADDAISQATDGERLRKIQGRTGLTCEQLGEVLGASKYSVHKLVSGRTRWCPLRLVILDALETALRRATPVEVWGPLAGVTPRERLARIFAAAEPSVGGSLEGPVRLGPRRTAEGAG